MVFLVLLALALGFNYFQQPFLERFEKAGEDFLQNQVETQISPSLTPKQMRFEKMSTREKILQVLTVPVTLGEESEEKISWFQANKPGFIIFFGNQISQSVAEKEIKEIQAPFSDSDIPPLLAVDHEGGLVQRFSGDGFTKLPPWKDACEMELSQLRPEFKKSAAELADIGINIVLAPVLDLAGNQAILQSRVCGDYGTSLETADEYILAFSEKKIMPVVKHFPGIGTVTSDLHGSFDTVDLSSQDTQAFKDILDKFPNIGLMTTHVGITGILDEVPCSLSEVCLGKLPTLYPEVLFVTDALEMESARHQSGSNELKSLSEVSREAILAGNNVLVFGEEVSVGDFNVILDALEREYTQSEAFRKKLDVSVAKILLLKKIDSE